VNVSLTQAIFFLALGIVVIIVLTARYRLHAFFALMIACLVTGFGLQMHLPVLLEVTRQGFGNVMKSLGFIIVLGTTLGALLEHSGSTRVMAGYILKKVGERNASLAISLTGFLVGLPVFCDSGFIVLSGLNNSLARRTGISVVIMSVSLASGLYAVHCLVPPHPGAAAAATALQVDFGKMLFFGILVALPAMLVGHVWASWIGKKIPHRKPPAENAAEIHARQPSVAAAFLPVVVPILLIAARSFWSTGSTQRLWSRDILALGDPVYALSIGVILAFLSKKSWKTSELAVLLHDAVEKAGNILIITGAGGAFGAVLAASNLGAGLSHTSLLHGAGILFPFGVAAVLKTAQGSSTVAIITAAAIVQPLLVTIGLATGNGPLLCVLAMGAGSMMISHVNDSYFWVIARFSGLDVKTMLSVYSVATAGMGLIAFASVYLLSLIIG